MMSSAKLIMWFMLELEMQLWSQRREKQQAQHAAMGGTCAQYDGAGAAVANQDRLGPFSEEVQDPFVGGPFSPNRSILPIRC